MRWLVPAVALLLVSVVLSGCAEEPVTILSLDEVKALEDKRAGREPAATSNSTSSSATTTVSSSNQTSTSSTTTSNGGNSTSSGNQTNTTGNSTGSGNSTGNATSGSGNQTSNSTSEETAPAAPALNICQAPSETSIGGLFYIDRTSWIFEESNGLPGLQYTPEPSLIGEVDAAGAGCEGGDTLLF